MISFVVIGKNIEPLLSICFKSIKEFIRHNYVYNYEIIYIDSQSIDNSINIANIYTNKIYILEGACNAARARNLGYKKSSGNIIFFVDGDMSLKPDFYKVAFITNEKLLYPFCSGDLRNIYIDTLFKPTGQIDYYFGKKIQKDLFEPITGGIFIIEKFVFTMVEGFKEYYNACEDYDIALRLSSVGYKLMRFGSVIADHYTISYATKQRMLTFISSNYFRFTGLLIREHFLTPHFIPVLLRKYYSPIILFLSIVTFYWSYYLICLYSALILAKSIKNIRKNLLLGFVFNTFMDLSIIYSFFLFYPQKKN